jgi:hypothetical protein
MGNKAKGQETSIKISLETRKRLNITRATTTIKTNDLLIMHLLDDHEKCLAEHPEHGTT